MLVDPGAEFGLQGFGPQCKTRQEEALQEGSNPETHNCPEQSKQDKL